MAKLAEAPRLCQINNGAWWLGQAPRVSSMEDGDKRCPLVVEHPVDRWFSAVSTLEIQNCTMTTIPSMAN